MRELGEDTALCFIHPHTIDGLFVTSLVNTIKAYPTMEVLDMSSGPRIATARNQIMDAALDDAREFQWFWLIDADMVFPSDTYARMRATVDEHNIPILGGLCFTVARAGRIEPTITVLTENDGLQTIWDFPENALVKCDSTGGACLLVHREVFLRMREAHKDTPYPYFADSQHGGYEFGEDVTFCLRARRLGYPVHVHTGIEIGHVKPYVYGLDAYRRNRDEIDVAGGYDQFRAEHAQRVGLISRAEEPQVEMPHLVRP